MRDQRASNLPPLHWAAAAIAEFEVLDQLGPSTLAVVEDVLRKARIPLSVPQIFSRARGRLPTKAKSPELVVARDLALNLRRLGDESPVRANGSGAVHAARAGRR